MVCEEVISALRTRKCRAEWGGFRKGGQGGAVAVLNMEIKVGLKEEVRQKHKPEGCEGESQKDIWGKSISGKGDSKS